MDKSNGGPAEEDQTENENSESNQDNNRNVLDGVESSSRNNENKFDSTKSKNNRISCTVIDDDSGGSQNLPFVSTIGRLGSQSVPFGTPISKRLSKAQSYYEDQNNDCNEHLFGAKSLEYKKCVLKVIKERSKLQGELFGNNTSQIFSEKDDNEISSKSVNESNNKIITKQVSNIESNNTITTFSKQDQVSTIDLKIIQENEINYNSEKFDEQRISIPISFNQEKNDSQETTPRNQKLTLKGNVSKYNISNAFGFDSNTDESCNENNELVPMSKSISTKPVIEALQRSPTTKEKTSDFNVSNAFDFDSNTDESCNENNELVSMSKSISPKPVTEASQISLITQEETLNINVSNVFGVDCSADEESSSENDDTVLISNVIFTKAVIEPLPRSSTFKEKTLSYNVSNAFGFDSSTHESSNENNGITNISIPKTISSRLATEPLQRSLNNQKKSTKYNVSNAFGFDSSAEEISSENNEIVPKSILTRFVTEPMQRSSTIQEKFSKYNVSNAFGFDSSADEASSESFVSMPTDESNTRSVHKSVSTSSNSQHLKRSFTNQNKNSKYNISNAFGFDSSSDNEDYIEKDELTSIPTLKSKSQTGLPKRILTKRSNEKNITLKTSKNNILRGFHFESNTDCDAISKPNEEYTLSKTKITPLKQKSRHKKFKHIKSQNSKPSTLHTTNNINFSDYTSEEGTIYDFTQKGEWKKKPLIPQKGKKLVKKETKTRKYSVQNAFDSSDQSSELEDIRTSFSMQLRNRNRSRIKSIQNFKKEESRVLKKNQNTFINKSGIQNKPKSSDEFTLDVIGNDFENISETPICNFERARDIDDPVNKEIDASGNEAIQYVLSEINSLLSETLSNGVKQEDVILPEFGSNLKQEKNMAQSPDLRMNDKIWKIINSKQKNKILSPDLQKNFRRTEVTNVKLKKNMVQSPDLQMKLISEVTDLRQKKTLSQSPDLQTNDLRKVTDSNQKKNMTQSHDLINVRSKVTDLKRKNDKVLSPDLQMNTRISEVTNSIRNKNMAQSPDLQTNVRVTDLTQKKNNRSKSPDLQISKRIIDAKQSYNKPSSPDLISMPCKTSIQTIQHKSSKTKLKEHSKFTVQNAFGFESESDISDVGNMSKILCRRKSNRSNTNWAQTDTNILRQTNSQIENTQHDQLVNCITGSQIESAQEKQLNKCNQKLDFNIHNAFGFDESITPIKCENNNEMSARAQSPRTSTPISLETNNDPSGTNIPTQIRSETISHIKDKSRSDNNLVIQQNKIRTYRTINEQISLSNTSMETQGQSTLQTFQQRPTNVQQTPSQRSTFNKGVIPLPPIGSHQFKKPETSSNTLFQRMKNKRPSQVIYALAKSIFKNDPMNAMNNTLSTINEDIGESRETNTSKSLGAILNDTSCSIEQESVDESFLESTKSSNDSREFNKRKRDVKKLGDDLRPIEGYSQMADTSHTFSSIQLDSSTSGDSTSLPSSPSRIKTKRRKRTRNIKRTTTKSKKTVHNQDTNKFVEINNNESSFGLFENTDIKNETSKRTNKRQNSSIQKNEERTYTRRRGGTTKKEQSEFDAWVAKTNAEFALVDAFELKVELLNETEEEAPIKQPIHWLWRQV